MVFTGDTTVQKEEAINQEKLLRGRVSTSFLNNITYTLTDEDKILANKRAGLLCFPKGFTGYKGDVFTSLKVLKNHHGWQEASNVISFKPFTLRPLPKFYVYACK